MNYKDRLQRVEDAIDKHCMSYAADCSVQAIARAAIAASDATLEVTSTVIEAGAEALCNYQAEQRDDLEYRWEAMSQAAKQDYCNDFRAGFLAALAVMRGEK